MTTRLDSLRWLDAAGKPIACTEKLKVIREALEDFKQAADDAMADAVLLGCVEADVRQVLRTIVEELDAPYPSKA
jgi:L-rhamnose isomerase